MAVPELSWKWGFWVVLLLALVDRAVMTMITMPFASDDLTVVWSATVDMAQGIFHEPFFYGQDYGVMLEALIAAPFVHVGGDPTVVIPWVIGFLSLAPFISFAVYHYHREEPVAAILFASMPMLLPVEHGLQITALNGIAIIAFYPWVLSVTRPLLRHFLVALVLTAAVFVNPNALVIGLPLGLAYVLQQDRFWHAAAGLLAGSTPTVLAWIAARSFYADPSGRVVNTVFDWRLHFKPELILEAFGRLDQHLAWTFPLFGAASSLALLFLVASAVLLFRQGDSVKGIAVFGALALMVLSLGFAKIHDGTDSILFPLSRMFLAIPVLLAWSFAAIRYSPFQRWIALALCLMAITNGALRWTTAQETYTKALIAQDRLPLRTRPILEVRSLCSQVAVAAHASHAEHILILRGNAPYTAQFLAYATAVFFPDAPLTWMVGNDRRAFQRRSLISIKGGTFLVVDCVGQDQATSMDPTSGPLTFRTLEGKDHTVGEVIGTLGNW